MIFGKVADALDQERPKSWFWERVHEKKRKRVRRPLSQESTVRVSELPYFCAREEAIRVALGVETYELLDWERRWKMSRGSGMHATMQDGEFPLLECIDGMWLCGTCGELYGQHPPGGALFGIAPRPDRCGECGGKHLIYQESLLDDVNLGLRGKADGFWIEKGALWEIKTCGIGTYRYMLNNGPPKANRVQAAAYIEMANRMLDNLRDHQRIDGVEPMDAKIERVYFLYIPLDDVTSVSLPAPRNRVIPYEVDSVTKAVFCEMERESVKPEFEEAHARVREFREWIGQFYVENITDAIQECLEQKVPVLLPKRHPACTCASNAGQWKWGCDFAKGCLEFADKFER